MSRTDKTRPHWVKVNDHGVEYHDHSMLGQPIWRTRNVTDADGELVYEELPYFYRVGELLADKDARIRDWVSYSGYTLYERNEAGNILHAWRWNRDNYKHTEVRDINKVRSEAMWLRANGKGNATMVPAGKYERPKTERYIHSYVPDHCTIDEKSQMRNPRYSDNPCYIEADWWGADRGLYKYRCSCCSPQGYNTAKRAIARDTLKEVAKQYNSGEDDWEDSFDARENITPRRKAGQSWW